MRKSTVWAKLRYRRAVASERDLRYISLITTSSSGTYSSFNPNLTFKVAFRQYKNGAGRYTWLELALAGGSHCVTAPVVSGR